MVYANDTIVAIATPPGEGGVGIVRLSGPDAISIADSLFTGRSGPPSSWFGYTMRHGELRDPATGDLLDDVILLLYRAPKSYTGEDVIEFCCHGGPVVLGGVVDAVLRLGARAADPGEFTLRAYLNGRLDLAQAEAVCDTIRARTSAAERIASRQRSGELSNTVRRLRHALIGAIAGIEASIDFSDEIGEVDRGPLAALLSASREEIDSLRSTGTRGRLFREGAVVAVVGPPNAGKSSLLNRLAGQPKAIVSAIPGTTRDVVEVEVSLNGIRVTLCDTAGLRETVDEIEQIGVERAQGAARSADLVLLVWDASRPESLADPSIVGCLGSSRTVSVANKVDLLADNSVPGTPHQAGAAPIASCSVSALTGAGMSELTDAISDALLGDGLGQPESLIVANSRHLACLEAASDALRRAIEAVESMPPDFVTIDLRAAVDALGGITGETLGDDVILRIFAEFCVGK